MYQALIWFGYVLQYHSTIIYNLVFMLLTTVKVIIWYTVVAYHRYKR